MLSTHCVKCQYFDYAQLFDHFQGSVGEAGACTLGQEFDFFWFSCCVLRYSNTLFVIGIDPVVQWDSLVTCLVLELCSLRSSHVFRSLVRTTYSTCCGGSYRSVFAVMIIACLIPRELYLNRGSSRLGTEFRISCLDSSVQLWTGMMMQCSRALLAWEC